LTSSNQPDRGCAESVNRGNPCRQYLAFAQEQLHQHLFSTFASLHHHPHALFMRVSTGDYRQSDGYKCNAHCLGQAPNIDVVGGNRAFAVVVERGEELIRACGKLDGEKGIGTGGVDFSLIVGVADG